MKNMLLDHDHAELDSELAGFFSALSEGDVARSFKHLDVFWARLAVHIRAENLHLFPTLLRASYSPHSPADAPAPEVVHTAIATLRDDHDFFMKEITAAVKAMRDLVKANEPPDAATLTSVRERMDRVSRRLEEHNALEESEVYRWVLVLLDEAECLSLNDHIQRELENLPPRLRK